MLVDSGNRTPVAHVEGRADGTSAPYPPVTTVPVCIVRPLQRWVWLARCAKDIAMSLLISVLITFLVIILVLYLVNMLPIDGRAKQIVRAIVIVIGVLSLLRYAGAWI